MALVAHWPLNGNYLDYSGNGYDLTETLIPDDNGKIGSCYKKDITNITALSSTSKPIRLNSSQTYACWVKLDEDNLTSGESITTVLGLFNTHVYTANANLGINFVYVDSYPRMTCNIGYIDETREYNVKKSRHSFSYNIWYHIALVYDEIKNNISFYINGKLDSTFQLEKKVKHISSLIQLFRWSVDYAGYNLLGSINDARLYNHALSSKEVYELSKAKILDWKMNMCEEPTENLNNNPVINGMHGVSANKIMDNNRVKRFSLSGQFTGGTYPYSLNISGPINAKNDSFQSISFYLKSNCFDKFSSNFNANIVNIVWNSNLSIKKDIINKSLIKYTIERISPVSDISGNPISMYSDVIYFNSIPVEGTIFDANKDYIEIIEYMLEEKNYCTSYVEKYRNGVVTDSSGFKNHGLIEYGSNPTYIDKNNSYLFKNSLIECKSFTMPEELSVNLFFKLNSNVNGGAGHHIMFTMGTEKGIIEISSTNNGRGLRFGLYIDGVRQVKDTSSSFEYMNDFHMATLTYDKNTIRGYYDGRLVFENVKPGSLFSGSDSLFIGRYSKNSEYYSNDMEERDIKIFATSLSDNDVFNLYSEKMSIDNKNNVLISGEINENYKQNIYEIDSLISASNNRCSMIKCGNNSFKAISLINDGYCDYVPFTRHVQLGETVVFEFDGTRVKEVGQEPESDIQFFMFDDVPYTIAPAISKEFSKTGVVEHVKMEYTTSQTLRYFRLDINHKGDEILFKNLKIYIKGTENDSLIDRDGILYKDIEERIYYKNTNMINIIEWKDGSEGSTSTFNRNGNGDCKRMLKKNPRGFVDVVWACEYNAGTGANGDGGWDTNWFSIDKTKKYRYTVWMKRENMGDGRGTSYFGPMNSGGSEMLYNVSDGSGNSNPYFWASAPPNEDWILFVAYVYPYTQTDIPVDDTGGYDINGNKIIGFGTCFRFGETSTAAKHRTYLYYSAKSDERMYWYRPRVDLCDGTEPTLDDLLKLREHASLHDFDYNIFDNSDNLLRITKNRELYCNSISEV